MEKLLDFLGYELYPIYYKIKKENVTVHGLGSVRAWNDELALKKAEKRIKSNNLSYQVTCSLKE